MDAPKPRPPKNQKIRIVLRNDTKNSSKKRKPKEYVPQFRNQPLKNNPELMNMLKEMD